MSKVSRVTAQLARVKKLVQDKLDGMVYPGEKQLELIRKLADAGKLSSVEGIPVHHYLKHFERKPSLLWPLDELESMTFGVKLQT